MYGLALAYRPINHTITFLLHLYAFELSAFWDNLCKTLEYCTNKYYYGSELPFELVYLAIRNATNLNIVR